MTIDNKTATEALRAIQDEEGRLTPDTVLRAAKNPRHPLHDVFEWNDAKAGHAWRVEQARALIARVRCLSIAPFWTPLRRGMPKQRVRRQMCC